MKKIAMIQLDISWEDKKANICRTRELVEKANSEGCDIAVLPEMFTTGFSMNTPVISEDEDADIAGFLSDISRSQNINIIAGLSATSNVKGKGRNLALVYNRNGERIAGFSKMHPFSLAGEHNHYIAGAKPVIFTLDSIPATVFICYDLRFPEVFRRVARQVELMFVIANWPKERIGHWETLLKARAIENQCFVIGVNRTGKDIRSTYPGASSIFDPVGKLVCSGGEKDELVMALIDTKKTGETRLEYPFLDDM